LTAITVKVYKVPFTSPFTTQLVAPEVEQLSPFRVDVTVYPLRDEPPSFAGTAHETMA
jgi:hypothetical protein